MGCIVTYQDNVFDKAIMDVTQLLIFVYSTIVCDTLNEIIVIAMVLSACVHIYISKILKVYILCLHLNNNLLNCIVINSNFEINTFMLINMLIVKASVILQVLIWQAEYGCDIGIWHLELIKLWLLLFWAAGFITCWNISWSYVHGEGILTKKTSIFFIDRLCMNIVTCYLIKWIHVCETEESVTTPFKLSVWQITHGYAQ